MKPYQDKVEEERNGKGRRVKRATVTFNTSSRLSPTSLLPMSRSRRLAHWISYVQLQIEILTTVGMAEPF